MEIWQTLEDAVAGGLGQLTWSQRRLLASVRAVTGRDRKSLTAAIVRERMPAAYICVIGRGKAEEAVAGETRLKVLLASRSNRSDDNARVGCADTAGIFMLAERAAVAVQGLVVLDRRLRLEDESCLGGEDGTIIWEQNYRVYHRRGTPAYGGVALAGAESVVFTELGCLRRQTSAFAFPGIEEVFHRDLGISGRTIFWRGQLRAANATALEGVEKGIEGELRAGVAKTLLDESGGTHEECVLTAFRRRGPRQHDELSGQVVQSFEIEFEQLRP